MRKWARVAIIAALAVIASPLYAYPALAVLYDTTTPTFIVQQSSLEPKFKKGDVVFVNHREPFEKLKVGDFVLFKHPDNPERVLLGIIIEKEPMENDNLVFMVKTYLGNPASIPSYHAITESNYVGKIVGTIALS